MRISPETLSYKRVMSANRVDLPAPLRPSKTVKAPRGKVSETLSSALLSPKLWLTPVTAKAGTGIIPSPLVVLASVYMRGSVKMVGAPGMVSCLIVLQRDEDARPSSLCRTKRILPQSAITKQPDMALEHFPTKWTPVCRRKCDQTKKPEHFPTKWTPVRRRKCDQTKKPEHFPTKWTPVRRIKCDQTRS